MAKKKPSVSDELELDRAYWELTGYKFNRKKSHPLMILLFLAAIAAACWYFDVPDLLFDLFN